MTERLTATEVQQEMVRIYLSISVIDRNISAGGSGAPSSDYRYCREFRSVLFTELEAARKLRQSLPSGVASNMIAAVDMLEGVVLELARKVYELELEAFPFQDRPHWPEGTRKKYGIVALS